jgi:D-aminoacyl-tRNA deacylase
MRALVQRVTQALVSVDDVVIGQIDEGMVIMLGVRQGDTDEQADWLADRVIHLRIFNDAEGRFDRSLNDIGGGALVIPQFTLYGDARRGRRPSFTAAALPEEAEPLYERFCQQIREQGLHVATGRFGAHMLVEIFNDGPVTLMVDTDISRRGNVRS